MSTLPSFSPAGAAVYSSDSLHVGDGTWDEGRNTFLLPNIQGLPFDVTRYNGMGNRFAALPQYHTLIIGHGVLAGITFLLVVPLAIFIARFYHRNPIFALKAHITIQVFTVILTTIVFVLGYFAVGPERALSNPHHGIGLAIYVLILVQVIGGSIIHRMEKGKTKYYIPIKLMLHQWMGRAIALLACAQIPIGLTLYGSPAWLFILYSLWMTFLIVTYFILTHRSYKRKAAMALDIQSYGTRTELSGETSGDHKTLKALTGGILGGAGIYALRRRLSGRHQRSESQGPMLDHRQQSHAGTVSVADEKFTDYSESSPPRRNWQNRVIGGVAGLGALNGLRRFSGRFDRRQQADGEDYYPETHHASPIRTHARSNQVTSQSAEYMNRMEAGMPPTEDHDRWHQVEMQEAAQEAQMAGARRHENSSQVSYGNGTVNKRKQALGPFGIPMSIPVFGIGKWFKRHSKRKEDERVEGERRHDEEGRLFGPSPSQNATFLGDGTSMRTSLQQPSTGEAAEVSVAPTNPRRSQSRLQDSPYPGNLQVPFSSSFGPPVPNPPPQNIPPPPATTTNVPPAPPAHRTFSDSLGHLPTAGQDWTRTPHNYDPNEVTIVDDSQPPHFSGGAGAATTLAPPPILGHSRVGSGASNDIESPPVSVRVRMHNDGRHVTLQRLPPEETAARERARIGQRQQAVLGASDSNPDPQRYRRYETAHGSQYNLHTGNEQGSKESPRASASILRTQHEATNDPIPSIFGSPQKAMQYAAAGPSAVLGSSQGGTGIQSSEVSTNKPDENRRRRRAERARAAQAREAARGNRSVDFM